MILWQGFWLLYVGASSNTQRNAEAWDLSSVREMGLTFNLHTLTPSRKYERHIIMLGYVLGQCKLRFKRRRHWFPVHKVTYTNKPSCHVKSLDVYTSKNTFWKRHNILCMHNIYCTLLSCASQIPVLVHTSVNVYYCKTLCRSLYNCYNARNPSNSGRWGTPPHGTDCTACATDVCTQQQIKWWRADSYSLCYLQE